MPMNDSKKFDDPLSGLAFAREDEVNSPVNPSNQARLCEARVKRFVAVTGARRRDPVRRPS